jgi:hypothetical protein
LYFAYCGLELDSIAFHSHFEHLLPTDAVAELSHGSVRWNRYLNRYVNDKHLNKKENEDEST